MAHAATAGMKLHRVVALWMLWVCMAPAWSSTDNVYDFDIPAQPLEAALIRYGVVSGHPALFPSDIVTGRTSAALRGAYPAETALRLLLDGTGLTAERRDSDLGEAFILKETATASAPSAATASTPAGMAELFDDRGYPGLVQTRIWQALCTDARTEPGGYRSLFRFQVDADGRVNGARLLRSSGEAQRDAAILETLQRVQIDRAPPSALVQHRLTMLLLPSDPHAGSPCSQEGQGR
jgi:TonB family protein